MPTRNAFDLTTSSVLLLPETPFTPRLFCVRSSFSFSFNRNSELRR